MHAPPDSLQVWNNCNAQRVVFQVVFSHFDLASNGSTILGGH